MAKSRQKTKTWLGPGLVYSTVLMVGLVLVSTSGCYKKNLAPQIEYSPHEVKILREEIQKMEWD